MVGDPVGSTPKGRESELVFRDAKKSEKRFPRISIRLILPNLVTLIALCSGMSAIRYASEGRFDTAIIAIVVAAVLDGLDGRLARVLRATSRFGAELDSLADFVDFGVAPGLILYFWNLHNVSSFGWFAILLFAVAMALRLARFNVTVEEINRPLWTFRYFMGMPAPAAAGLSLLPLYLHLSIFHVPDSSFFQDIEALYLLVLACLMASRLPHFSLKSLTRLRRDQMAPTLFALIGVFLLLFTYPIEVLLVLSVSYLISIPFTVWKVHKLTRSSATH